MVHLVCRPHFEVNFQTVPHFYYYFTLNDLTNSSFQVCMDMFILHDARRYKLKSMLRIKHRLIVPF